MNPSTARRQGQPVLFLALLVAGWFLLRVLTWQDPWPTLPEGLQIAAASHSAEGEVASSKAFSTDGPSPASNLARHANDSSLGFVANRVDSPIAIVSRVTSASELVRQHFDSDQDKPARPSSGSDPKAGFPLAQASVKSARDGLGTDETLAPPDNQRRWRFDGWVSLREGGALSPEGGALPASYGASQVGAVLAYRVAPSSALSPAVYVRGSRALIEDGESEVAAGLRVRPAQNIPIDLHVEARVTDRPAGTEIRPAVFATAGFYDVALAAGVRARGYAQAGYVHGEFATAFADGKFIAERTLARHNAGAIHFGAGAWGGAQEGASRLDIGPSISSDLKLGQGGARLELDYRFRIAGNAEPANGAVLTLSTGF